MTHKIGERSANAVARPGKPLQKLLDSQLRQWPMPITIESSPAVCCNEAYTNFARDFGISLSCLYGHCLMSRVDQADPNLFGAHEESVKMTTVKTERHCGAQMLE